ncbi:SHOCT domain-containing protein [Halomarina ordinaria]|uniref:SHOCT domain-containing protein n=1 Tax=Halomarina ordinaria TaxID=3033939 RepID=A0ABD5U4L8_9EURY|nr:SHOCT domain-containing protein [Halomarina sp. PSRA2]
MDDDGPLARLRENATGVATTLVTGLWLAGLFTGQEWWLAALIVGYVVVIPIVAMLFGDEEDRAEWWDEEDTDWWGGVGDWFGTGRGDERTDEDHVDASTRDASVPDDETPLETLRRRYAAGELTDAQFERKLDRLLSTDTLENAEDDRARRLKREREREAERERESE